MQFVFNNTTYWTKSILKRGFGVGVSTPFYFQSVWTSSQFCYCIPIFIISHQTEVWVLHNTRTANCSMSYNLHVFVPAFIIVTTISELKWQTSLLDSQTVWTFLWTKCLLYVWLILGIKNLSDNQLEILMSGAMWGRCPKSFFNGHIIKSTCG